MEKKRILAIGDGGVPTGFGTVMHNVLKRLPKRRYEVHQLAVNYRGDPQPYKWKMYPALLGGDPLGYQRLPAFKALKPDLIFMLNDIWCVNDYLEIIKESWKEIPPIIAYFPIDGINLESSWFNSNEIVSEFVTYTDFAFQEVSKTYHGDNLSIIPHGVDKKLFHKLDEDKISVKRKFFPKMEDIENSFIVLMCQRNQPRKRVDIGIKAFSIFAEDKPKNVMLYLHMGIKDAGIDILKFANKFGIGDRLVISGNEVNLQHVPENKLNMIYNACDVGFLTSTGEGWNLPCMEHAVTGAPQIVPNHSAMTELYSDCGVLIDPVMYLTNLDSLTEGSIVAPGTVAKGLELLYTNKDVYNELSRKSIEKFSQQKYDWNHIVSKQWIPLFEKHLK